MTMSFPGQNPKAAAFLEKLKRSGEAERSKQRYKNPDAFHPDEQWEGGPTRIVDKTGKEVKLNDWQKNQLYSKWKSEGEWLKERVAGKDELWKVTPENMDRVRWEKKNLTQRLIRWRNMGRAVGMIPKETNYENLRKGYGR